MNLLVLPDQPTKEDQGLWREAIRRGWKIIRFKPTDDPQLLIGYDMVRYYGNILHQSRIENIIPIKFLPLSPTLLSDLDISWTGRDIKMISFGDLGRPLRKDTFIKCVGIKWMEAKVYKAGENPMSRWQGMKDTDQIYIQEPIEFINEIRCFVIGRDVETASYYRKKKEFLPENIEVEDEKMLHIRSNVWNMTADHMPTLPRGIVLDYGQISYGHWYLIEANEAWASGLYDCDPAKVFDCIIASQEDKK